MPSGRPQARPTIFCAKVKPCVDALGSSGFLNKSFAGKFKASRALAVKPRPIIKLIRPPARTSSNKTGDFNSKVENGRGLTLKTVKADLEASVKSLTFNKYPYKNIILDGVIDQNTFAGILKSDDENIDFVFDGTLEYLNKQAFLQFKSTINNLDLKALNLSKSTNTFKADLDVNILGSNINDFIGNLNINNLVMSIKDTNYHINQVSLVSFQSDLCLRLKYHVQI